MTAFSSALRTLIRHSGATMFAYLAGSTLSCNGSTACLRRALTGLRSTIARARSIRAGRRAYCPGVAANAGPRSRPAINLLGQTAYSQVIRTTAGGAGAALVVMVCAVGTDLSDGKCAAMADYPDLAGTASSLQGLSQFVFGAIAAPIVGIAGEKRPCHLASSYRGQRGCHRQLTGLVRPSYGPRAKTH